MPDGLIRELVQHSVDEVIHNLPKYRQKEYNNQTNHSSDSAGKQEKQEKQEKDIYASQ